MKSRAASGPGPWWIPCAVLAAGAVVYLNSLSAPFAFDDRLSIVENHRLRFLRAPGVLFADTLRPVTDLTFALNYAAGGLAVTGYHVVNLAIHLAGALLLFGLVRCTLQRLPGDDDRRRAAPWLAGAVAALWAVHPLQTQAVTYLSQRAESLMGCWFLLTVYAAARGAAPGTSRGWSVLAVAVCALGMASKPVMAGAPLLVWLHDRTFSAGSFGAALRRRPWLYGGLAATWGVLAWLVGRLAHVPEPTAGFAMRDVSPLAYAITQPGVILHYLRLAAWPDRLTIDYGWPLARSPGAIVPPSLVLALLLAGCAWALRRRPALGFLGAWFFVTLAPSSSVVPVADAAFEHRMYLPLAALIALAVVGGHRLLHGLGRRAAMPQALGTILALAAIAGLGAATIRRNADYRSAIALWSDVVAKRPQNSRGHANLGYALAQAGRAEDAITAYTRALQVDPDNPEAHNNLGETLGRLGRLDEAVRHLREAVRLKPGYAEAYNNLGNAAAVSGDLAEAEAHYRLAIRLKPGYAQAHNNLAVALTRQAEWQDALRHYREALRLDPDYTMARDNVAQLLTRRLTGRPAGSAGWLGAQGR